MAWQVEGRASLGYQGYTGPEISEIMLANRFEARVYRAGDDPLAGNLRISHWEDLYNEASHLNMGIDYLGQGWELGTEMFLQRSSPGRLNEILFFPDPDSLQIERSSAYDRLRASLRAGLRGLDWSLDLALSRADRRYDDANEVFSDLGETRLGGALRLPFALGSRLQLDVDLGDERYRQRPASDARGLEATVRLRRSLGSSLDFWLRGELLARSVADAQRLAFFERPGGQRYELGAGFDFFGPLGSGYTLGAALGREDWEDYPGYYHSGEIGELTLQGGQNLGSQLRLDLLLELGAFAPDSLPGVEWSLLRSRELRLNADCFLRIRPDGPMPLSLGLMAEELILESMRKDRFLLLQGEVQLDWRLANSWQGGARLRADRYESRYADLAAETEWGLAADLRFGLRREAWLYQLRLSRQRLYGFLEESLATEDWETGIEIRWHP